MSAGHTLEMSMCPARTPTRIRSGAGGCGTLWRSGTQVQAYCVSPFKIFLSLRIVLPNGTDLGASFFFWAITASLESFTYRTLTYLAQAVTENGFLSVHPAAITVNVFRENGRIIQFGP